MKKITAVVVGYGQRGSTYAHYAVDNPEEFQVVAVADATAAKRATAKHLHNLSDDRIFTNWKDLAAQPKMADFAIIATQDNMHYEPALALIEKGYNLLLEKPMAVTPKECKDITEAAEKKGVKVVVCHVLRFTDFWRTVKRVIDDGKLGNIMSIVHMENVGNVHQSHSFVRGNWRNSIESTPMILAKSCHDMDILQWIIGKDCTKVQSFGDLTYFNHKNRPEGAPDYCVQGCPVAETCPYNAHKVYIENKENAFIKILRGVITGTVEEASDEAVMEAITSGPYGRCVFNCDNDVVDHQVVNLEFDGGCTVSFTMNAFNEGGRFIRIFGTKGELVGSMHGDIQLFSFDTKEWTTVDKDSNGAGIESGHGGGDTGIMRDILSLLRGETPSNSVCAVRTSYMNHLISFAAEQSRVDGTVIKLQDYADAL